MAINGDYSQNANSTLLVDIIGMGAGIKYDILTLLVSVSRKQHRLDR